MSPIWILLAGLATVIGGILLLRLHAFLALILGALVVGLLTPPAAIRDFNIDSKSYPIVQWQAENAVLVHLKNGDNELSGPFVLVGTDAEGNDIVVDLLVAEDREFANDKDTPPPKQAAANKDDQPDSPGEIWLTSLAPKDEFPDDAKVLRKSDYAAAIKASKASVFGRITSGLGTTCGKIGLLIAFASIIGYCLQSSGAAERIVTAMLSITGERGAPLGFMLSGFLLSIPVFFDTVFYLMIPLGQALHRKTGKSYLMYVLSIVAGGTMAHSLVPPTPGPLFVAEELGVDMGLMMLGGTLVGLPTLLVGYLWARFVTRKGVLELPADAELPVTNRELPSLALSLLPILVPVVLIAIPLVLKAANTTLPGSLGQVFKTLGDRNVALAIAAAFAIYLGRRYRTEQQAPLAQSVEKAIGSAGIIILITSAGGAFGGMLRSSGLNLSGLINDGATPVMLVTLAFVATTVIRTAQGSATVAMLTAVGIFGPLVTGGDLGFHPLYIALAIGAGSKPVSWMNDSGFWVITRMSGMTEVQGLKYVTPMTTLMALSGLGLLLLGVVTVPKLPF